MQVLGCYYVNKKNLKIVSNLTKTKMSEGMVGSIIWVVLQIYLAFQSERILKIR